MAAHESMSSTPSALMISSREIPAVKGNSKCSSKSTAAAAQRARVIAMLCSGPQTSYDLRRRGIYQAPARILELRDLGYDITTTPVEIKDEYGFSHRRVALYTLVDKKSREDSCG